MTVSDREQRARALDPATSFIVQAPAGSGKTELLIQRYLALLGTVERPEEILAITFTRKAAGEMRDRILGILAEAQSETPPAEPHRALTWGLARAALERDRTLGWGLADSPSRLQVMTIDGFNALLVRRLPLVSGVGGSVSIADDPAALYDEAARGTLARAGGEDSAGRAAATLLEHLDNNFTLAQSQLCYLLSRRDHWLPRILAAGGIDAAERRRLLEEGMRREIERVLGRVAQMFPARWREEWVQLAAYAAERLAETKPDHRIVACRGLAGFPDASADRLLQWRGLADLLLVAGGGWRRAITKTWGFPPDGPDEKTRIGALLEDVREDDALNALLQDVRSLPPAELSEDQWSILNELLELLPVCAGELELVFRRTGQLDYVALARHARDALGDDGRPSDLALALDYRIRHILVDEYQDVSAGQVELLRLLTSGWSPDDGRTLFCVGDPMQSIYRFREAEVALYLHAREHGINDVRLEPLTLEMNFRSASGLVEWFNENFAGVFPRQEQPGLGAVSYAPSTPARPAGPTPAVVLTGVPAGDSDAEATVVADTVEAIRQKDPAAGIAVLVRARSHLAEIAPTLRRRGIKFEAVDIEPLHTRQSIQDLFALTRAICHLADRTAWLSILRAPWCGLRLDELAVLTEDPERTLRESLRDVATVERLSEDAQRRLTDLRDVMERALGARGRRPLHRVIEGAWVDLGGPATLPEASELDDARQFFRLLRGLDEAGELEDVSALEEQLAKLYAAPDADAGPALQLMTVHKAKGLEFDHVILPGLDRRLRSSTRPLIHWQEMLGEDGRTDLLLAPVEARGEKADPLQVYVAGLENRRDRFEQQRLLYVATTRARQRLYLLARLPKQQDDGEYGNPASSSPLAQLWPALEAEFLAALAEPGADAAPVTPRAPAIERLVSDWQRPASRRDLAAIAADGADADETDPDAEPEFDWAGTVVRVVGTVTHRYLERVAEEGPAAWHAARIEDERLRIAAMLAEGGVPPSRGPAATTQVIEALSATLGDDQGRWVLSADHREARSEFAVAGVLDGRPVTRQIDRCFLDDQGVRWIVDFKISPHDEGDIASYLDAQTERYRSQLEDYARLLARLHPEDRAQRVGLYYTLQGELRSWVPGQGAGS
jgi:ATP-dependent exoDNAse (exonuclease V) beta subunit